MPRSDRLAFDRASVRIFDQDGHLHVSSANLSKAVINPYQGSEIPDWERLRLDPNRIYNLLRDPDELEKAAPSFSGKPLLIKHTPIGADDHPHEKVVGAVGDARYEHPYLKAPLHIWPGEAIDLVKSGDQAQLSCGYRYEPDMTPGTYEGERYDGVMRNLVGNHVALVEEGRAGPDCVVGDSKEKVRMAVKPLSRKGAMVLGAVLGHLTPKLAQDKKLDLAPLFRGVTAKNYAERKTALVADITKAAKDKLAQDADLADLAQLLDAFTDAAPVEEDAEALATEPNAAAPAAAEGDAPDPEADGAGDPIEKIKSILKANLPDEVFKQVETLVASIGKTDAPAEPEPKPDPEPKPEVEPKPEPKPEPAAADKDPPCDPTAKDKEIEPMMTKPAMDAAIADAVAKASASERKNQRDIRDAEKAVRPYVGELALVFDSAAQVYRHALKVLGVTEAANVHESALPILLRHQKTQVAKARDAEIGIAQDSAGSEDFFSRFPETKRLSFA